MNKERDMKRAKGKALKAEGWMNVYETIAGEYFGRTIFETRPLAVRSSNRNKGRVRIARVRVTEIRRAVRRGK